MIESVAPAVALERVPERAAPRRLYHANAPAPTNDEMIAAAKRAAIRDNTRIISADSALVYQIVQKMQTLKKNAGFRMKMELVQSMDDFKAEMRYAVKYRFKRGAYEGKVRDGYLVVYRNF